MSEQNKGSRLPKSKKSSTDRQVYEEDQSTAHLTDDFLDKFHIKPDWTYFHSLCIDTSKICFRTKEHRCKAYGMKSELLFHCLSYLIGSPQLIRLRQKIYCRNVENILSGHCPNLKVLAIGSTSEGLDMEGSDIDILCVLSFAHETNLNYPGDRDKQNFHFRYRSIEEGVYPGYVLCVLSFAHETNLNYPGDRDKQNFHFRYRSIEEGVYPGYVLLRKSSGAIVRSSASQFFDKSQKVKYQFSNHGPAMMNLGTIDTNIDIVNSMKSLDWPEIANGWNERHRKFGWPSQEMITNITRKGCNIVPVGKERNHDMDTEWRLSFCAAERELVWTFNQPQILIYGLLKLVLKEIINPSCIKKDLICSYFLKTVMFWVIEETSPTIWSQTNMMFLFHITFNRLVQFVADDDCPNYFIPANNMLKDRISNIDRTNLLKILIDIEECGMAWMLNSKSLKPFARLFKANWTCSLVDMNFARLKSFQKGKLGSFHIIQSIVLGYKGLISKLYHQNTKITQIWKSIKPFILRSKIAPFLAHFIRVDGFLRCNKDLAALRTIHMDLLVQEAFGCFSFGKHMLALHFYCEGRFNDCLRVLNSMLGCIDYCIIHQTLKTSKYEYLLKICMKYAINVKYLQYFLTFDIILPHTSLFVTKELIMLLPFERIRKAILQYLNFAHYFVYPETFVHFLRCLCHIQLGNDQDCRNALRSLQDIEYAIQSEKYRQMDSNLWIICYAFIKEGINLDYTNEANFMRYEFSQLMEPGFPHHYPNFGDIDKLLTAESPFKSNMMDTILPLPAGHAQLLRECLGQIPKHVLDAILLVLPPNLRQLFDNALSKL